MEYVDSLPRHMRALVREYGLKIVAAMIDEGYTNASELWPLLETWRERRQEEWLATDYITKRTARQIVEAVMYRAAERAQGAHARTADKRPASHSGI